MATLEFFKDETNRVIFAESPSTGVRYEIRRPAEVKKYVGTFSKEGKTEVLNYKDGEKAGTRQSWDILKSAKAALQGVENTLDPEGAPAKEGKSEKTSSNSSEKATLIALNEDLLEQIELLLSQRDFALSLLSKNASKKFAEKFSGDEIAGETEEKPEE